MWKDNRKVDPWVIGQIHREAVQEMEVLYLLEKMGGKATIKQLAAAETELSQVNIRNALKRQEDAGNVKQKWSGRSKAWELV